MTAGTQYTSPNEDALQEALYPTAQDIINWTNDREKRKHQALLGTHFRFQSLPCGEPISMERVRRCFSK